MDGLSSESTEAIMSFKKMGKPLSFLYMGKMFLPAYSIVFPSKPV